MSVLMKCTRAYTLRTKAGHTIRFEPDKPVLVPDAVVAEALAVNILPVDSQALDVHDSEAPIPRTSITGILRDALALKVIDDMVRENDAAQFDAGGRPKTHEINQAAPLDLSAAERSAYWDKYRTLKSSGEELPTHKALPTVMEIQYLSTPKEIAEYADALGVKDGALQGHSIRAQKQILLGAAVRGA